MMMVVMTMMMTKGTVMTLTPMMKSTSDGQLGSRLLPTKAHLLSTICTFRFKSKPFFYSFVLLFPTPNLAMLVELTNIVLKQFLILFFLVNFRPSFPSFAILFFSYPLAE